MKWYDSRTSNMRVLPGRFRASWALLGHKERDGKFGTPWCCDVTDSPTSAFVVLFFKRQSARSALRKEAHIAAMLMNEICLQRQFLVGTFALRARDNFEHALGADCLFEKMNYSYLTCRLNIPAQCAVEPTLKDFRSIHCLRIHIFSGPSLQT